MNILLIGKPGSGKGTLSYALKQYDAIAHLSSGDMLREEIASGSTLGQEIASYIDQGHFAPEALVTAMIDGRMKNTQKEVLLLDGFPRNVAQLEKFLTKHVIDLVVYTECSDELITQRITGRSIHQASGRIYNDTFAPPKVAGLDDVTGEPLFRRPDDNIEALKKRLAIYEQETAPMLPYLAERNVSILTLGPDADIEKSVLQAIDLWRQDQQWTLTRGFV